MNPRPGDAVRISIRSSPWQLAVVRAAVEKMCNQVGMDDRATGEMMLGVDEALTNVIRHAYEGSADEPIEIELSPSKSSCPLVAATSAWTACRWSFATRGDPCRQSRSDRATWRTSARADWACTSCKQ